MLAFRGRRCAIRPHPSWASAASRPGAPRRSSCLTGRHGCGILAGRCFQLVEAVPRIARQIEFPSPSEVRIAESPVAEPGSSQLLVEASRTLISAGTEQNLLEGDHRAAGLAEAPDALRPGYSWVGRVVQAGDRGGRIRRGRSDRGLAATRERRAGSADRPPDDHARDAAGAA